MAFCFGKTSTTGASLGGRDAGPFGGQAIVWQALTGKTLSNTIENKGEWSMLYNLLRNLFRLQ
jgi:hypothetical protein